MQVSKSNNLQVVVAAVWVDLVSGPQDVGVSGITVVNPGGHSHWVGQGDDRAGRGCRLVPEWVGGCSEASEGVGATELGVRRSYHAGQYDNLLDNINKLYDN